MARVGRASFRDPFIRSGDGEVIFERAFEFDLITVPLDHTRQISRSAEGVAQGGLGYALVERARLEACNPLIVARIRCGT